MRWIEAKSFEKQLWGARGLTNVDLRRRLRQRDRNCKQVITDSFPDGTLVLGLGDRRGRLRLSVCLTRDGVASLIETLEEHLERSALEDAEYDEDEEYD